MSFYVDEQAGGERVWRRPMIVERIGHMVRQDRDLRKAFQMDPMFHATIHRVLAARTDDEALEALLDGLRLSGEATEALSAELARHIAGIGLIGMTVRDPSKIVDTGGPHVV